MWIYANVYAILVANRLSTFCITKKKMIDKTILSEKRLDLNLKGTL